MILEYGVLLDIIQPEHEGSDGIVSQGQADTEQREQKKISQKRPLVKDTHQDFQITDIPVSGPQDAL